MASSSLLVVDIKGPGSARVGELRGGLFFEQIGPNLPAKITTNGYPWTYHNNAVRYRGAIYVLIGMIVYRLDVDSNTWIVMHNEQAAGSNWDQYGLHSGLIEYMLTNRSDTELGWWFMESGQTPYFVWTADGENWSKVASPQFTSVAQSGCALFDFNGGVYGRAAGSTGAGSATVVDTATHTVTVQNELLTDRRAGSFFVVDDRLFYLGVDKTAPYTNNPLEELSLGTWLARLVGSVNFGTLVSGSGYGNLSALQVDEDVYVFGVYNATGLMCMRFYVNSPGGAIQAQSLHVAVIPSSIRTGTATIGTPATYRCCCFVDNETDPANPVGYIMFQPDGLSGAVTLFRFNGPSAEMSVVGSPQADGDFSFPATVQGGGNVFNGLEGSTPLVTGRIKEANKGIIGLELVYELRGDQTRLDHGTVASGPFERGETILGGVSGATGTMDYIASTGLYVLVDHSVTGIFQAGETITQTTGPNTGANAVLEHVLPHGAVTGGPFEVGESILGGTSGATAVITYVGLNVIKVDTVVGGPLQASETITQTSGTNTGAVATTTSDAPEGSSGGVADKTVQFRYYLGPNSEGQGVPATGLCTLVVGTVVGGGTLQGGNTQIGDIPADDLIRPGTPVTQRSVEWDFANDGVPLGLVERIQIEAIRP